jgi:hypothetical protein
VVEELESRTLLSVFTPFQIRNAYGINKISLPGVAIANGAGETIAVIDAYYDPTIQSDLATFNKQFNLAPLDGKSGDGSFSQVDLSGGTQAPSGTGWPLETSLDVEWAHAIAPKANIVLVEALSDSQDANTGEPTDLLNAVSEAVTPTHGQPAAQVVSMSWGINEVSGETNWDSNFNVNGVSFTAASGDSGAGVIWPSASPYVISTGGTTLQLTSSNTILSEAGWGNGAWSFLLGGSGGGFSQVESLPSYQSNIPTVQHGFKLTSFGVRLNPDVAFNADPNTGVYVYDAADGGWNQVGGTSAAAPAWAGLIAIADQGRVAAGLGSLSSTDTLNAIYNSSNVNGFHDITRGNTGTYNVYDSLGNLIGTIPVSAIKGYDMVTGMGSPVANVLVPELAKASTSSGSSSTSSSSSSSSGSSSSGASGQDISAGPVGAPTAPTTPNNPGATGSSNTFAAQLAMALTNSTVVLPGTAMGTQASIVTSRTSVAGPAGATTAAPAGFASASRPRLDGGAQRDQEIKPPDDQPAVPADRDRELIPAPEPVAPLSKTVEFPFVGFGGLDSGLVPNDSLPGMAQEESEPGTADELLLRLEPAAAVYGLAVALAMNWKAQASPDEERASRRARVID